MPLTIIKGPPNSGRTELVRERFEARLADNPVLVVPSTDDIFGWERRLTRERGAFLGGKVVHFKDLVSEVLAGESDSQKFDDKDRLASPIRRRALATSALEQHWPVVAARLSNQPGLVDAALGLIDELRENGIDPDTLQARALMAEGQVPGELEATYRAYLAGLGESGLEDLPQLSFRATRVPLDKWQGRPVFVAGFDDFTEQQLNLLSKLADQTEVTVAITHETENKALAVTESLLERLISKGGKVTRETIRPDETGEHAPLLQKLERCFHRRENDGSLEPDDSLTFLYSAGNRGEAEAVGEQIARLVADDIDPGEIAIAVEGPDTNGLVFRDVLQDCSIPVVLESEIRAAATATGRAVCNLIDASLPGGEPASLFAYLRGPIGLDPGTVDEAEFMLRRSGIEKISEVARFLEERTPIGKAPGWDEMHSGKVTEAAKLVAELAARNLIASSTGLPDGPTATEAQMSTAISEACDELARIGEDDHLALSAALTNGDIKTWSIPTSNSVRIASPYSMRAKRAKHLFIVSLQEKNLSGDEGGPFLTAKARQGLQLPEMTDEEKQELYLFYSCLSVPTDGLWLSTRTADVHGKQEFPSPMIREVERLFTREGKARIRRLVRTGSDIVFPAGSAPSLDELRRSVAAGAPVPDRGEFDRNRLTERVDLAAKVEADTSDLSDLDSEGVLELLAAQQEFSASALELFIECPYRWFFERALNPSRFGPEPEPLARGNLIHDSIFELYSRHKSELPRPKTVDDWKLEVNKIVEDLARTSRIGMGSDSPPHRIEIARIKNEIARFLERETQRSDGFVPEYLEQEFGFDDDGVDFGTWKLRGRIDRIDTAGSGKEKRGILFDYKSGGSSFKGLNDMAKAGRIQLHLYLKAAREMWGLKMVAGLYVPLFRGDGSMRGIINAKLATDLAGIATDENDFALGPDFPNGFEGEIDRGVKEAGDAVEAIREGKINHRPGQCRKHFHHAGVPDWKPADQEGEGSDE